MLAGRAERALRRSVAKLAALQTDDVEAILSALTVAERRRVEGLMATHIEALVGKPPEMAPAARAAVPATLPPGLSATLEARISHLLAAGGAQPLDITPKALETLRALIQPAPEAPAAPPASPRQAPGLIAKREGPRR